MQAKLLAYFQRAGVNDYNDLRFLTTNFITEIFQCRGRLDYSHRAAFYATYHASGEPANRKPGLKMLLNVAG